MKQGQSGWTPNDLIDGNFRQTRIQGDNLNDQDVVEKQNKLNDFKKWTKDRLPLVGGPILRYVGSEVRTRGK